MKKRLLALFCVLALLVSGSAMVASADSTTLTYDCPHCKKPVDWEPIVFGSHFATSGTDTATNHYHGEATHLHYYLDKDYTASQVKQMNIDAGITVCMDLRGRSITCGNRLYYVHGGGVVNAVDTVGTGSVYVTTQSVAAGNSYDTNNVVGTIGYVEAGSTLRLYGGTYGADNTSGRSTKGMFAVLANATCEVYGGTFNGTTVSQTGGTFEVYNNAALNVYGGTINSGTAPKGECVCLAATTAKLTVSGNATIENVYLASPAASNITVSGAYTGSMGITLNGTSSEGLDIGDLTNSGNISGATMTTTDGWVVNPSGTNLILSRFASVSVAGVIAADGTVTSYDTLQKAVDAYKDGYISLLADSAESVTVTKDVVIAMNGKDITGTVTVAEGATLYGMDSKTDDFTVKDGDYGKISKVVGNIAGLPAESNVAEDGYLMVKEGDAVSFHRVDLKIYAMTLRSESVGLYYRCNFAGDEKVAAAVQSFGITMTVNGTPNAETMNDKNSSSFTGFVGGANGNLGNSYSTLLNNVLKEGNSKLINKRNASLPIYGRAYIKTVDGIAFGMAVSRTLMEQLEGVDDRMDSLALTQVKEVVAMYKKFSGLMGNWNLTKITEAAGKTDAQLEEDSRLKVLVIGNSHGLDATNLLYEVFQDQAPQQNVLVGALYYDGCNMTQHANFAKGNEAVYSYHKNSGQNADHSWDVAKPATILDALQDEQWDIIVMQQMNHRLGMDNSSSGNFVAADWQYVIDYVKENQDYMPRLAFHMVWANPDQDEYWDPASNLSHPTKTSTTWADTHTANWPGTNGKYDMDLLYSDIIANTQKHLVDTSAFLGENYYEFIIPSGTAVQYALRSLDTVRTQSEIYRDYTHMSDYGRLIAAYLWYAKIMGLSKIDNVGINAIPSVLHHSKSTFPTAESGYAVDDQMKLDIIECVNWALEHPFELPAE